MNLSSCSLNSSSAVFSALWSVCIWYVQRVCCSLTSSRYSSDEKEAPIWQKRAAHTRRTHPCTSKRRGQDQNRCFVLPLASVVWSLHIRLWLPLNLISIFTHLQNRPPPKRPFISFLSCAFFQTYSPLCCVSKCNSVLWFMPPPPRHSQTAPSAALFCLFAFSSGTSHR